MRSLFIYWKLPAPQAAAALAAARAWQARLCAAHPGLNAALYQRVPASDDPPSGASLSATGPVTVMETYAMPGGINPGLEAAIVDAGTAALQAFGAPRRHIEVFVLA